LSEIKEVNPQPYSVKPPAYIEWANPSFIRPAVETTRFLSATTLGDWEHGRDMRGGLPTSAIMFVVVRNQVIDWNMQQR
jgi:hypothetical protein